MWQILDAFDDVWNNPSPRNKIKLFESDTRSKGAPYTTVIKWAKPLERARLSTAASKEYRQSLLRIDKVPDSRRKGRFPEMEREVFRRFKEKRARGRKVSARWVSSTARQVMKELHPAVIFSASYHWRARWRKHPHLEYDLRVRQSGPRGATLVADVSVFRPRSCDGS